MHVLVRFVVPKSQSFECRSRHSATNRKQSDPLSSGLVPQVSDFGALDRFGDPAPHRPGAKGYECDANYHFASKAISVRQSSTRTIAHLVILNPPVYPHAQYAFFLFSSVVANFALILAISLWVGPTFILNTGRRS